MKNNDLQDSQNKKPVDIFPIVNELSTKNNVRQRTYRKMYTQLSTADYLDIEKIAFEKNSTPYKISSQVLTLWLHGELVYREPVKPADV